ncbi:hypothetical protein GCM10010524_30230 [Streptomyces mexicanus]
MARQGPARRAVTGGVEPAAEACGCVIGLGVGTDFRVWPSGRHSRGTGRSLLGTTLRGRETLRRIEVSPQAGRRRSGPGRWGGGGSAAELRKPSVFCPILG